MTKALWAILLLVSAAAAYAQPTSDELFTAIGLRAGSHVCEIGAGDGALTVAAAHAVGPTGRVSSSELGDSRVARLREKVTASGVDHITVIAGDPARTNFRAASCDVIVLRDVYHHLADPLAITRSMAASLKPGGRVGVVDFTPPPGSRAPTPGDRAKDGMHGIHPDQLTEEMAAAGFEVVRSDVGGRWFMLVFALKP